METDSQNSFKCTDEDSKSTAIWWSLIAEGYHQIVLALGCKILQNRKQIQILEESTSSTFRVGPEHAGSTFLQNTGIHLQENMVPQTRKLQSEQSPKWKPQNV
jgi:hypothetical protein